MNHAVNIAHMLLVMAALLGALGICWTLLCPVPWRPTGIMLAIAGWAGMLATLASSRSSGAAELVLPIGIAVGCGAAWWLAGRFEAARGALLVAGAIALPLRVPIPLGSETVNVLAPLYVVILCASMLHLRRSRQRAVAPATARMLLPVDIAVSLITLLAGLSLSWSIDIDAGAVIIGVFVLPFSLVYCIIRVWVGEEHLSLRSAGIAFTVTMVAAAMVGIAQHATHHVWQNPKVIVANVYAPDFRTNSVFWDPNIYGRYLVAALCVVLAGCAASVALVRRETISLVAGVLMLVGLWYTYSQSSAAALAVACIATLFVSSGRLVRAAVIVTLIIAIALVPSAANRLRGSDKESRAGIVASGASLASIHPVRGLGVGSFQLGVSSLARERGTRTPSLRASHTTPVTVMVEMGVLGVIAWLALLAAGVSGGMIRGADSLRVWGAAVFGALVAHSMFYAAFLEDPLTWIALAAIAASIARRPAPEPEPDDADDEARVISSVEAVAAASQA